MRKETKLELKVGFFVLIALIALTVLIFSTTDFSFFTRGKDYKVIFNFANGLKKAAPVRVAGVDQGEVQSIDLFFDQQDRRTKVVVIIKMNPVTKIPVDSEFIINQLGLLGEKYIEVIPGMETKYFFDSGDTIIGKDPFAQETISKKVVEVASKIEKTIDNVNEIIGNPDNQNSLKLTLEHLGKIFEQADYLLTHIKEGKGTVGKFFTDESIYDNIEEFTADLKLNPWKLLYVPKQRDIKK